MKTAIRTISIVAMIVMEVVAPGCSPTRVEAASGPEPPAARKPARTREAKISAPVELALTSSASSGTVVLTLAVRALTDIPRGVARIILPDGIKLLSGQREVDFGALAAGSVRELVVTADVPASRQFQIFAGIDCHISSGIQQHKEAQPLYLGPSSSPSGQSESTVSPAAR